MMSKEMTNLIYFDYGATTPIDSEVFEAYVKASKYFFANTSSLHFLGKEANQMMSQATNDILNTLSLSNHDLIYTASATEANNLAILGYTKGFKTGKIITTQVEHPSVYQTMQSLEGQFEVCYLDVDETGHIRLDDLKNELDDDTILVSIMWVNNIVGSVMDIAGVIGLMKQFPKAKLHVDVVQGLCKIGPLFDLNDIDLFSFSTHKMYGPKGVGGLFVKKGVILHKIMYGSEVQYGLRPGTIALSLVVATAKAIKKFWPQTIAHEAYVSELFHEAIISLQQHPKILINTPLDKRSPYVINLSIPSIKGETIVHHLEASHMYVSTGSACSSKLQKPERTVFAMTHDLKRATSSIRITLSHLTTHEEMKQLLYILNQL